MAPKSLPPPFRSLRAISAELRQQAEEFTAGPYSPEADAFPTARQGRRLFWWDGFFSNISESFVTNFVGPFALSLGATNTQIGWLSAISNLTSALALFPGARLAERPERRKRVIVITGGIGGRALLLAIAAVPLLFHGDAAILAFLALVALRGFMSQLSYPAWSALSADLVPTAIRGRYFAARNIALAIAALIAAPLAGRLAESLGLPRGYQVSFALAGLVGFVATVIYARIPMPAAALSARPATGRAENLLALFRRHPRFTGFTAVAFLWNISLAIAGPFFAVYLVRSLHASPTQIGLLAAVNSVGNIIGQRVWGRLNDRHGAAWLTRVTGFLIPLVPILWSLAPNPWYLMPVETLSGFAWAGYSLAGFNLLLGLAPAEQRARFTAIYQVAVFGAAFVGPLIGTALVNILSIRPLFWISAAGRVIASTLFVLTVGGKREHAAEG